MSGLVYAIGDSVMQGAGPELYATLPVCIPAIEVDAAPYRQFRHAPSIIRRRLDGLPRPAAIVVHLGSNGTFSLAAADELIAAVDGLPVVLLNVKAPRDWESTVNVRLVELAAAAPTQITFVDWHAIACEHPHFLRSDGLHLSRIGALGYADAIARHVN